MRSSTESSYRCYTGVSFFPLSSITSTVSIAKRCALVSPRIPNKSQIDATMERRICTAVLKQLDDNSNDVQTIAVKCLGALLRKVQEAQVKLASRISTMDFPRALKV